MKNNIKFYLPEFESYLSQKFKEIKEHLKINAQTFAHNNFPLLQSTTLNASFEEDHFKYQALIDEVNKELQFKTVCHKVAEHKSATEKRLREINHKRVLAQERHI